MPKQQPKRKGRIVSSSNTAILSGEDNMNQWNTVLTTFQPSEDWKMLAGLQLHHFDGLSWVSWN